MRLYNVAVVGATGMVGRKIIQVLAERNFPVGKLVLLASHNSIGKEIEYENTVHSVQLLNPESFKDIDIALFSAGASVSKQYAPIAVKAGAQVIDNSSAYRMDPQVPLVVPEVNRRMIFHTKGIIANPNCSTIQMVVALKPIHDRWRINRIVVATYQAVTGAGYGAMIQLEEETAGQFVGQKALPHRIAGNLIPQVDILLDDGYTKEEYKMIHETKKIMEDDAIKVCPTCVRVPVVGAHSEAVNIELDRPFELHEIRTVLQNAPGVVVEDDPKAGVYPMPITADDKDAVFVGRLRRDESVPSGIAMWIVSDNLRKGAATNAVQIAEEWIKGH